MNFCLVQEFLEESTIQKVGHLLTLKQLYEEFGKHLVCSTYNYDRKECEYLDHINSPNLPCITALRMSSNLPFLFHPFTYEGSLYYDGAMLDNFPLSQLNDNDVAIAIRLAQARDHNSVDDSKKENEHTSKEGRFRPPPRRKYPWTSGVTSSFDFMTYVFEIMHIPMESVYKLSSLNSTHKPRDIVHVFLKYPSFRWGISMTDKFNSFSIGYETMRKYFQVSFIIPYMDNHTV
jgi:predicted acylesterase/phospholipase RssA